MALSPLPVEASSGEPYRYEERADFTGGLNLRADQFNLELNESPDLLNVDVDPRGGVSRRNGIDAVNATAMAGNILSILDYHSTTGTNQMLVAHRNAADSRTELRANSGSGNFSTQVQTAAAAVQFAGTQRPQGVTFNDALYVVNGSFLSSEGTKSAVKWTGSNNATSLTPDIDASDGHFPNARYVTTWGEFVWVAYTVESGTTHANRVRFSKINDAENWTNTDYFDVDVGEHGDFITALLPDGDRLLIFKQNSIYAVYGFGRDTFEVQNITRNTGCLEGSDPVSTTVGVFYWYAQNGVYLLSRDNQAWAFERIKPSIDIGRLSLSNAPSLMWFDERLWVSVDYQSGDNLAGATQTGRRNVLVWDPTLGEYGAWTRYDINARSLGTYRPPGGTHLGLAVTSEWSGTAAFTRVCKVDQDLDVDKYDGSSTPADWKEIYSHYQTGWFSGNRPTFPKRWGKTRTVMLADNTQTVNMAIYKDYDLSSEVVTQSKAITGEASQAKWDTAVWDTDKWVAASENIYKFFRWPTAGTAKAISLRFSVTPSSGSRGKWGLTSVLGMYRTRRIR
tara:strand:+ start:1404 stop:3095 length:1692 start_codon:yes stop_codon:yes gene_type:complete